MSNVFTEPMDRGVEDLLWMVIVGGICCFSMGFGIGANDVANNFGSSVGSGAIKFGYAILIAAVFELVGALGFGASVTDSVRKGILDPDAFVEMPEMLMYGNFCALISGTLWLLGASAFGYPVSTTHTIIGSLFGVGLATGIAGIVDYGYLGTVVLSWFTSPVISCMLGMLFFYLVRSLILRQEKAISRAKNSLWITTFCLFSIFTAFFVFKNPSLKDFSSNMGVALGSCFGVGLGLCLITTPILQRVIARKLLKQSLLPTDASVDNTAPVAGTDDVLVNNRSDDSSNTSQSSVTSASAAAPETAHDSSSSDSDSENSVRKDKNENTHLSNIRNIAEIEENRVNDMFDQEDAADLQCTDKMRRKWYSMPWYLDLHKDALSNDLRAATVHDKCEVFASDVEAYFSYLQVVSACVSCVVHGANDVANATAPFSTVYGIYKAGQFETEVTTPLWILALGGCSISVGVMFLGHKVIQSIGIKLVKITPSRGFCIELGMATVMVIGSMLGIPLSTTHCQVGSTIGIGLIEKHEGVVMTKKNCGVFNWEAVNCKLIGRILISWVATIVVSSLLAAAIFSFGAYSPDL